MAPLRVSSMNRFVPLLAFAPLTSSHSGAETISLEGMLGLLTGPGSFY